MTGRLSEIVAQVHRLAGLVAEREVERNAVADLLVEADVLQGRGGERRLGGRGAGRARAKPAGMKGERENERAGDCSGHFFTSGAEAGEGAAAGGGAVRGG